MRYLALFLLLNSMSAFSKDISEFNKLMTQDLKSEITKDEDRYKVRTRAPASVAAEEPQKRPIEETPKIDKTIRQIGPNNW